MKRHTKRHILVLAAALLGSAPLLRAQSDAEITTWKTEFQNAPKTSAATAQAAYGALLEKLLPGMSNADYGTQARTQEAWEKIAVNAGRPGAEAERLGAVQAMLVKLNPATPQIARIWLLKQLENIGKAESVAALTPLMSDADAPIRGRALRAMANNGSPAASAALMAGLKNAPTPEARIEFINPLGFRREAGAVAMLATYLDGGDAVSLSAADALGSIGTVEAGKVLVAGRDNPKINAKVKLGIATNIVRVGESLLAAGDKAGALPLFQLIWKSDEAPRLRAGGLRGIALTRGGESANVLFAVMADNDAWLAVTASRLLVELPKGSSAGIAALLPAQTPAVQVLALGALAERGENSGRTAALALAGAADEGVKLAALAALARLGEPADVPMLSRLAANDKTNVGKVARESLDRLPGDASNSAMVKAFVGGTPEVRAVLAASLAARRAANAGPEMLAAAEKGEPAERIEAIKALGVLGDGKVVPNLVKMLAKAPTAEFREATQTALKDILENRTADKTAAGNALVDGLVGAHAAGQRALFTLMKSAGGDKPLAALVAGTKSTDETLQDAAVRALSEWPEESAVPVLRTVAVAPATTLVHHVIAVKGIIRLCALPSMGTDERSKILADTLTIAKRPDEKRAALGGLAKVLDNDAIAAARPLLDGEMKEEAALAIVSIAKGVAGDDVKSALQKVVEVSKNADTVKKATELLNRPSVVRAWQILGPFTGDNLFGKDLGIEKNLDLKKTYMAEGNKPLRFKPVIANEQTGYINFLDLFDVKESAAAYAVIFVKSTGARTVRLSAGSDDGIKIWINNKQVIANDAARAANPGDEQKDVELKDGWNEIKLKITQGGGDWGFYFDLQGNDKKTLTDLVWSAKAN